MNYLIAYFLLGLFVVPTIVALMKLRKSYFLMHFTMMFLVWPLWIAVAIWEVIQRNRYSTHCAWCGERIANYSKAQRDEAMREHLRICNQHPIGDRIRELETKIDKLRAERAEALAIAVRDRQLKVIAETKVASLRPEVLKFAQLMEAKLRAHDDRPGWKKCAIDFLLRRLEEEVDELADAIYSPHLWGHQDPEQIASEAVDVANFAMMIADIFGGLND